MLISTDTPITWKDHPGTLSAVFYINLNKCNLNCYKCHNRVNCSEFQIMSQSEFEERLNKLKLLGVELVIISGGEPLLEYKQGSLIDYLEIIKSYDFKIRIDTNGTYPEDIDSLAEYVDGFAVDVKIPINPSIKDCYSSRYKEILYSTDLVSTECLDFYRKSVDTTIRIINNYYKLKELPYSLLRTVEYPQLTYEDKLIIKEYVSQFELPHYFNPFYEF